jgi:hypothetical protein
LLAGQIKAAAFVDELTKLAIPSMGQHEMSSALTGLVGAADLYKYGPWGEGGRSRGEAKAHKTVQELEQQDQTNPQVQEALRGALSNQLSNVHGAERAGGLLGAAGLSGGALYARTKLLKNPLIKSELNSRTTPEELIALHSDLTKQMGHAVPTTGLPEGGMLDALSVPKGGFLPKFLRGHESKKYVPAFAKSNIAKFKGSLEEMRRENPGLYDEPVSDAALAGDANILAQSKKDALHALETGHVMAPMKAGPHFTAHEFGHAMFGNSTIGKLTHALRAPAAYAGGIAGMTSATMADPDSTASKLSPLMGAAGVAPILGEEAMASINAIKSMKRTGLFSPQQMSLAKRQLGKGFGTYALGMGLPAIAAPYLIRKVKQYNQSRRESQGLESPGQLQQRIQSLPQTGD